MSKRLGSSQRWVLPTLFLFLLFLVSENLSQIPDQSQSETAKRIQAGKKLSNEGEHKEAIIQLLEGLNMAKTREETSEACLYLALCYYALGERASCARFLKNLFEAQPEREIEALYFPAAFVGQFYQAKNEAAKQSALKPEAKAGTKAEEKKAEPEKKIEPEKKAEPIKKKEGKPVETAKKEEIKADPEKKKEEQKPPAGIGKGAQASPAKKKGKFPWLVAGGVVVGGGILAVVLLNKKEPAGPQVGNVAITSTPNYAKVYLDGNDTGQRTNCTLTSISTGSHGLKLELENCGKWEGSVTVIGGQTANVSATLAGYRYEFVTKWGSMGSGDGQFDQPWGIAAEGFNNVYGNDNIYVADKNNARIQKFSSAGTFITKWGRQGNGDGEFNNPHGVAVNKYGAVYVTALYNDNVQKFNSNGSFILKWGGSGSGSSQFNSPRGIAVGQFDRTCVSEQGNYRLQVFSTSGVFVTMWGSQGSGDGQFDAPFGVAVDNLWNVYVVEAGNNRVQKFTESGSFVSKWGSSGTGDGQFSQPSGIAADREGYIYVGDRTNHRVQKFTSDGVFMTKWGSNGVGNGQFNNPWGVAVDGSGNVYVADMDNHRIQKFRMTGETQQAARISYAPLRADPLALRLPEMRPWPSLLSLPRMKILPQELPRAPNSPEGEKQKRK